MAAPVISNINVSDYTPAQNVRVLVTCDVDFDGAGNAVAKIEWGVGDYSNEVIMDNTLGDTYEGEIPGQLDGVIVQWRLNMSSNAGDTVENQSNIEWQEADRIILITQDNQLGSSDLLAVQSPLSFLIDFTYVGSAPNVLYCDIYNSDDDLLDTFKCIPYKDLVPGLRQFIFIADSVLRGYMDDFEEFVQTSGTFQFVDNITTEFKLTFRDPDDIALSVSTEFTACHASRQFGENPNMIEIFNNEIDCYITSENKPVYVYFYNDDPANIVTVEDQSFSEQIALDYDDTEFADFDDTLFTIDIIE